MFATAGSFLTNGLKSAAAMVWMTWWPLVLGFTLSGCVQAFVRRGGLRGRLGANSGGDIARASVLGMISSSCSYAASAMARSLFARGASWTASMVFMIASTNLVIELGIVLWLLLGWQFLVAELVGGVIMIAMLWQILPRLFPANKEAALREHVETELGEGQGSDEQPANWRTSSGWGRAFGFAFGDLNMLKRELFLGFLVAGFLAADVPTAFWHSLFLTGHGFWTTLENVIVAPFVAVISFVCSVGNIPLAAALWSRGVSFGGVIAFVFADLITLPLLLIYRRFYGAPTMWRLLGAFWFTMSAAGLLVELLFRALGLIPPHSSDAGIVAGTFDLGWTLWLNVIATVVLVAGYLLYRRAPVDTAVAIDPVCGMQVARASAPAHARHHGVTYYFCAPRCAQRFNDNPERFLSGRPDSAEHTGHIDPVCSMNVEPDHAAATRLRDGLTFYFCSTACAETFDGQNANQMVADETGDAIDPVCQMRVDSRYAAAECEWNGVTYFFCSPGCRDVFVANPSAPNSATKQVRLGRKPS